MIDGVFYEGITDYVSDNNTLRLAIIPDAFYEASKILYDNKDITSSLKDGFITINLDGEDELDVKFSSSSHEKSSRLYRISGRVMIDGESVENAVVILNNEKKSITNSDGYYSFEDVSEGVHSLLIIKDGKGIGFTTFKLLYIDTNTIDTYKDDNMFVVALGKSSAHINMNICVNDDFFIHFDNVDIHSKCGMVWLLGFGLLIVGIVIFIVCRKKTHI